MVLWLAGADQGAVPLGIWASHHGPASSAKDYFEFSWSSPRVVKVKA